MANISFHFFFISLGKHHNLYIKLLPFYFLLRDKFYCFFFVFYKHYFFASVVEPLSLMNIINQLHSGIPFTVRINVTHPGRIPEGGVFRHQYFWESPQTAQRMHAASETSRWAQQWEWWCWWCGLYAGHRKNVCFLLCRRHDVNCNPKLFATVVRHVHEIFFTICIITEYWIYMYLSLKSGICYYY